MTQQTTSLPSPPPEKTSCPPAYAGDDDAALARQGDEKQTRPICNIHPPTTTPTLDAHLQSTAAQSAAQTLIATAHDATDGQHCTRCTANEAARTLTRYLFEVKRGRKAGMGKGEKRALKSEVKGLMREVRDVVREEKARLKGEAKGRV